MYLLMPTTQNVDRVIADFSDGREQYLAAHVFFIEGKSSWRLDTCSERHQAYPRTLSIAWCRPPRSDISRL